MAEPLRRVGRYELLEVIGRGGTAVVYLANQPDLNRQVALKELSPHHAGDPRFAERFISEARLAAALNHPSIVTVHEFFEHDGLPYISMEYLPRGSLRPYLATLTLPQIFGMAENVLAGLAHGEEHQIIHRDLKPENLLVTADGQVKISDYGVARALNTVVPRPFATMTGTTIGTPAYMAPEQALGEKLGPEADLYSLGIIIWETLAGRPPFGAADTPMAVLYQKIHEPVQRITELEADVDPGLAQWLDVMLAKSPAMRFSSASAAWEELEEVAIKLLGPRWRRDARATLDSLGAVPRRRGPIAVTEIDEPAPPVPSRDAPHVQWNRTPDPPPLLRRITPSAPERRPDRPPAVEAPAARAPAPEPPALESPAVPIPAARIPTAPAQPEPPGASPSPRRPPAPIAPASPGIWGSMDAPRAYGGAASQSPGAFPGDNPAYQTIVRHSRRHVGADEDIETPEDEAASRHWVRYVAVALLVAIAAGAGAAVGIKSSPSTPVAVTQTYTTASENLAYAVRPILSLLAYRTDAELQQLKFETTMKGQAAETAALHDSFKKADISLFKLPPALKALKDEKTLFNAVTALTEEWLAATQAASGGSVIGYNLARKAISEASPKFAQAAAAAAGGEYTEVVTTTVNPTPTPTPSSTTTAH